MDGLAVGEVLQRADVPSHQRFLLGPAPPLQLPLGRESLIPFRKLLRPKELNRPLVLREPRHCTRLVLRDSIGEIVRVANVIMTVRQAQDVDVKLQAGSFYVPVLRDEPSPGSVPPQDERKGKAPIQCGTD
jgi:hypothetical protein